jgi:beta-galactosidase
MSFKLRKTIWIYIIYRDRFSELASINCQWIYKHRTQFVTQNFDFEWRGHSYGIQPDVDHFESSKAFDITGVDIYHPSQDDLTGIEISFGGDMAPPSIKTICSRNTSPSISALDSLSGAIKIARAFSHVASGACFDQNMLFLFNH